ncbi:MAG TPA: DNA polymerase IV [Nitrospiria bacterium]|nr:DNA polymerase IV [Nitrospiria bacterium]
MPPRIIAHLDMDAFFAAVEERERPHLKGLPIAVGADPMDGKGRGVVATANYPARVYGLHSAMPITQAWRRSEWARRQGKPAVVFLRPHFEQYRETSGRIRAIVERHASSIEQAGIDEMYIDLSTAGTYERAQAIAIAIKRDIATEEHLTASIGIGPNKLIAKIASDARKPDGLTVVEDTDAEAFLAPLSVRKIPGIGPKTEITLRQQGITKVQDLKRFSEAELVERFGKWGRALHERVRGRDEDPVQESDEVKSIGEEETFLRDTLDARMLMEHLKAMARDVVARLTEAGYASFRTVVIKVRFADFETKSRSHTLPRPTTSGKDLEVEAMKLFLPFLDRRENPRRKLVRLIGLRVEKLGREASGTSTGKRAGSQLLV